MKILKVCCLTAATFALTALALLFISARSILQSTNDLLADSRSIILNTDQRIDQSWRLVNASLIHADLILARVEDASRTVREGANKQAEYWETMQQEASLALGELKASAESLNNLIANTDLSLNKNLLPAANETIQQSHLLLAETTTMIADARVRTNDNLEELRLVIADPAIKQTLSHIELTMQEVHDMSAEIRQTAPKIVADIQSISDRSDRWHPWVIAASLAGTVIGIFGFVF